MSITKRSEVEKKNGPIVSVETFGCSFTLSMWEFNLQRLSRISARYVSCRDVLIGVSELPPYLRPSTCSSARSNEGSCSTLSVSSASVLAHGPAPSAISWSVFIFLNCYSVYHICVYIGHSCVPHRVAT